MPLINFIPERFREGFKKVGEIDDVFFKSIVDGLSYSSLVSSLRVLIKNVSQAVNDETDSLEKIFLSVGSLIPFLNDKGMIEELSENVAQICIDLNIVSEDLKSKFIERVIYLLNNEHIYYASKADVLITESGNIYIGSRIVTDVRPVFGLDLDEPPKGALIVHNLHLHFQADEEADHKDIYLALDLSDIAKLKEALIRAEKKEASLQLFLDKSGMTNLNT